MTSNRIELRSITIDDKSNIFLGLADPEVVKYYGVSFDSFEATEEQID